MADVIIKYDLPMSGVVRLAVPFPVRFLSVGFQHGVLRAWASGDPTGRQQAADVHVVMTGQQTPGPPGEWRCLGRSEANGGAFIAHVFVETRHG